MANRAVVKELLDLERQYWQAIKDKDAATAMRLSDEPCIVAGAQGVGRLAKAELSAMIDNASYTLESFELKDDVQVEMLGDDVALLAYKVHEELIVDDERVAIDAADSSVWVRRDGRWVCALHTESLAGDPFGRDRHPTMPRER
jgi:hypothetical protein